MSNDMDQRIEHLQRRHKNPVQGILAATALGRKATLLRTELDTAPHLARGGANNAVLELELTLWDMIVLPMQRAAAAWALGQIGGLQAARKLLNRLEHLFVSRRARVLGLADQDGQEEGSDVRATLVEALAQAVDARTLCTLKPSDRQQLRQVCSALLDHLRTSEEPDPDLSTSLAMSLAKLALRAPTDLPRHTLHNLLHAPEPTATLVAVGALGELIPAKQWEQIPNETLDAAFRELETRRGQSYSPEERHRLLQLASQLWYAEQDTQVTGDRLWDKTR